MQDPFIGEADANRMAAQDSQRASGISLQVALLALVAAAFLAGMIPAGLLLERWVARELEVRVRADLMLAPRLLADRNAAVGDMMMMHAKELAHSVGLGDAVAAENREGAVHLADAGARALNSLAVLIGPDGGAWAGPPAPGGMIEATRRGEMPVGVVSDSGTLYTISIAPVEASATWTGAAGVATPLDEAAAGSLAGLTRSDLVIVLADDGTRVAAPAGTEAEEDVVGAGAAAIVDGELHSLSVAGAPFVYSVAPLNGGRVIFARDMSNALAILGPLRRALTATAAGALALALLLGAIMARGIARPVRALATAAGRLSEGDFQAPLAASAVTEVQRVTSAFDEMRRALAIRIDQLREANRLLEERQARLSALQSELIQRERVAATGRIAAELAHEIRNPVANLRNCLELLHRRLGNDPEGREYAALAIDELLRMHELAERMLQLNRPRAPTVDQCDAAEVATEVAALARVGVSAGDVSVRVEGDGRAMTAVLPDALKQVLLNLVQNARDAKPHGLEVTIRIAREKDIVVIEVSDNGPGISPEIRDRIFDPFFTTRETAGGVGLGLFVVEGIVRGHGGTVSVSEGAAGGAQFRIILPAAKPSVLQRESILESPHPVA
jgi:signal transduction histidine kinase